MKYFCCSIVSRSLQICVVISGSLCFSNLVAVMSIVSVIGILTYRSFISNVINLCFVLMLSLFRSYARVFELIIV